MKWIDRIRQMTDEELAEFLSKVDAADKLRTCAEYACPDRTFAEGVGPCAVCMLRWLREEGPLMDGEGV